MASTEPSPRKAGFFRWSMIVPALAVTAAAAVFAIFYLDAAVKWGIERAGTKANGAKVDVEDVDISLLRLSVTIRGLQVADRGSPMTNVVEVRSMVFRIQGKPLAWKKIVIEKGEIAGIRMGTPRTVSGAIPVEEKETAAAKPGEAPAGQPAAAEAGPGGKGMAAQATSFTLDNLREQYDPDKLIQPENLASYRKVQEERARLTGLSQQWQGRVDSIQVEGRSGEIRAWIAEAKNRKYSGAQGIQEARKTMEEAKKYRDELNALSKTVSDATAALNAEIAGARNSIKEIDSLKDQDYKSAVAQLRQGAFSAEGLSRGVLGPVWFGKLQEYLGWFHRIRAMIPQSKDGKEKKEKPAPPPRREGRVIKFPFKYNWPAFHLVRAAVDGLTSGEAPLSYSGVLTDVTSGPRIVGRPMRLKLEGSKTGDPRTLNLEATLDYTRDTPREAVDAKYAGLPLAGVKLGDVGGPVSIESGAGRITADLKAHGEKISGEVKFVADPVKLDHAVSPEKAQGRLVSILSGVLAGMKKMDVEVLISGTIRSPDFKIRTSIDRQLNQAVKQVLDKELEKLRAQMRQRINGLVDGQKKELTDMVNSRAGSVTNGLGGKASSVQGARGEIDKLIEDLQKQATSGAQQRATDAIRGLRR